MATILSLTRKQFYICTYTYVYMYICVYIYTEITQLDVALVIDEQAVLRFKVTVHNRFLVQVVHGVGDPRRDLNYLPVSEAVDGRFVEVIKEIAVTVDDFLIGILKSQRGSQFM